VTVFLIVTALVNIALGYGLALYLGHTRTPCAQPGAADALTVEWERPPQALEDAHESAITASPAVAASPALTASPAVAASPAADPQPASADSAPSSPPAVQASLSAPAAADDPVEIEQEMLAGIAEFRNQLALMKGQPDGADAPKPVPAPAVS
jgi:hypothetical protein